MPERYYHALEFVPRKSDPTRKWALSVKQPLAGLVARGITPLITKSSLPPPELIGKRIALHAGAGDVPYKDFSDHAAEWVKVVWGCSLADLRAWLPKSGVIATVTLEAAFRIKRVVDSRAYAHRGNAYSAPFAGLWERHDTRPIFEMRRDLEGRYAWALTEPKLCPDLVPLKGMGGIFDLSQALKEQGLSKSDPGAARHGSGSGLGSGSASGPSAHEAGSGLQSPYARHGTGNSPERDPSRGAAERGSNQKGRL